MEDLEAQRAEIDLLRRRVLSVVGHELRTPVTTLRGLAELLGTTAPNSASTAEIHAALQRSARRIELLIDDALVALGVTTALPVGDRRPTPVATVVNDAWTSLASSASPPKVEGDAVALVRPKGLLGAVRALLDNAAKYGAGDTIVRIAETNEHDDPHVRVEISDHGLGVPAAEADLLFEPFFRSERAVMAVAGLGLGLPVARRLIEHDGGTVQLRATEGAGITATIQLEAVR